MRSVMALRLMSALKPSGSACTEERPAASRKTPLLELLDTHSPYWGRPYSYRTSEGTHRSLVSCTVIVRLPRLVAM
jgi:hypothetical protein